MPDPAAPPALDVHPLRQAEFPAIRRSPYLNAASFAPMPERTRRAVEAHNRRRCSAHDLADEDFEPTLERCREAAAALIGADVDEIALGPNTSFGINLAVHCLPLEPGSTVVVSDREFPANVYPWMGLEERGIRLERVDTDACGRPDEDRLLERLHQGDVSAFALSAVQFSTGYRADLARFGAVCRERGIRFVVDAIQALGQLPLDVREAGIDVLATGGQKWLCAPFGSGFAYVRREIQAEMEPRVIGWTAMQASDDYSSLLDYRWELCEGARKFEVATPAFQSFAGLAESLALFREVGTERIAAHLQSILEPVLAWVAERGDVELVSDPRPEHRSGIACFRPPCPESAFAALQEAGISCALREGAIRLSPHLYNTAEEVRQAISVLDGARA